MDEGPFRMPRPADRSATNRPVATSHPVEEPKAVEEPKPVHRTTTAHRAPTHERSKKPFVVAVATLLALVIVVASVWALWPKSSTLSGIDGGKYQAVFFTNGQVYFGKLQAFSDDYLRLTDIYYLQTQATDEAVDPKNPQQTSTDQNSPTLIKLGDEIHGPEDEMIISRDQVLFYENLKSDGKVSQSIEKFKNPN